MDYWQALTRRFKPHAKTGRSNTAAAGAGACEKPDLPDRGSRSWGKPAEWMNCRVPEGCAARLKRLADGHDLHRWQVLVAALDCFEATYGPGNPRS